MRWVVAWALGLGLLATACSDDEPAPPGKEDSPEVISGLGSMDLNLDDFNVCDAAKTIPNFEQRAEALLGGEVVAVRPYPNELSDSGQECYVVTRATNSDKGRDGDMVLVAAQGPDIANEVSPKDEEIYPKCFASHEVDGKFPGVGVRCRPSLGIGLSVLSGPERSSWPQNRQAYLDLLTDLLVSLSKQG